MKTKDMQPMAVQWEAGERERFMRYVESAGMTIGQVVHRALIEKVARWEGAAGAKKKSQSSS